jgi:hypothetical protein
VPAVPVLAAGFSVSDDLPIGFITTVYRALGRSRCQARNGRQGYGRELFGGPAADDLAIDQEHALWILGVDLGGRWPAPSLWEVADSQVVGSSQLAAPQEYVRVVGHNGPLLDSRSRPRAPPCQESPPGGQPFPVPPAVAFITTGLGARSFSEAPMIRRSGRGSKGRGILGRRMKPRSSGGLITKAGRGPGGYKSRPRVSRTQPVSRPGGHVRVQKTPGTRAGAHGVVQRQTRPVRRSSRAAHRRPIGSRHRRR